MKRLLCVLLFALLCVGCSLPESNEALLEFNDNCEFGGAMLGMTVEGMEEALGEPDAESIITGGTEYAYHLLDLSAAINDEGVVRRLSGKNGDFRVFGIAVGDDLTAAGDVLLDKGYQRDAAPGYRYNKNEVQIILLTVDEEAVVGFTAEWLS